MCNWDVCLLPCSSSLFYFCSLNFLQDAVYCSRSESINTKIIKQYVLFFSIILISIIFLKFHFQQEITSHSLWYYVHIHHLLNMLYWIMISIMCLGNILLESWTNLLCKLVSNQNVYILFVNEWHYKSRINCIILKIFLVY